MDSPYTYSRRYRGPLRGVILDWAGTTLDYGCFAPAVVFVDVFKRQGVPISIEEARAPMGAHKKVHIRKITQIEAVAERWQAKHGRAPDERDIERMFGDFVPLQMEVLGQFSRLIPGTVEAVEALRRRGLKIGSSTGYTGEMMRVLLGDAKRQGYAPDASVCATDVPAGRPEPWMCLQNARELGIYPMEAMVKVGDTLPDIEEGLNAGMWTIGLSKTGNEMGMREHEVAEAPPELVRARLARATERLLHAGAHDVVDGIWDVPAAIDRISERHARGERP